MSIVDLAHEKLEARDVVRRNGAAMGDAVPEHADARHGHSLSGNVFTRGNEHFRRARHEPAVRDFRGTVYRPGKALSPAERPEVARRFFSRKLFPAHV